MPRAADSRVGRTGLVRVRGAREHNLQERRRRHPARRAGRLHRRLRAPASRRWRSARSTPKRSGATSSRCRPTRAGCSIRSACRTSTRSTGCRRRWRCSSSAARRPRGRRSAASPRSRTCCGCSTRAPATIRRAQPMLLRRGRSRPTRRRAPARPATASAAIYDATEAVDGARRLADASASAPSPPGRRPGTARTCATSCHARLRRRHAVARPAEEGSRLAALHRRAADRAGLCRLRRRPRRGAR